MKILHFNLIHINVLGILRYLPQIKQVTTRVCRNRETSKARYLELKTLQKMGHSLDMIFKSLMNRKINGNNNLRIGIKLTNMVKIKILSFKLK